MEGGYSRPDGEFAESRTASPAWPGTTLYAGEVTSFESSQARVIPPRPAVPAVPAVVREPLWRHVVGDVLRRERLAQERTLRDVAEAARISMPYLSELERGRKEGSSEVLAAAAHALGLGLADLLGLVQDDLARLTKARQARARIDRAVRTPVVRTPAGPAPRLGLGAARAVTPVIVPAAASAVSEADRAVRIAERRANLCLAA